MPNCLVILGPTASGKTRLGVQLARQLNGEIISADSRQVYSELTIGSGKDLAEYIIDDISIPYHLIDIANLSQEFSLFDYLKHFTPVFSAIKERQKLPILVGGTGLYLEAVLRGYEMVEAPENVTLRAELASLTLDELRSRLLCLKPNLHNTTDTMDQQRLIRAIEIAEYSTTHPPLPLPKLNPLILGVQWNREVLRQRIAKRLQERMQHGLIEEVQELRATGIAWERLELLGLEYRFIAQYLQGAIKSRTELFQKLNIAIGQFAKRQETWFRRMERNGIAIQWIPNANIRHAVAVMKNVCDKIQNCSNSNE